MKFHSITLIAFCTAYLMSCSRQKIIKLPLTQQDGYGYFQSALGGISPYSEDENNPWRKTYLKVIGAPKNWTDIKYGDIETNIYQSVYQNYLLGNITKERYEELQKSWDWEPDTLELSKKPLKTKIAFAFGKDSTGEVKMIVDANNNLDLSDEDAFLPIDFNYSKDANVDSLALYNSINVSYEKYVDNKIVSVTAPLFIAHMSQIDMFMCNFPQYSLANFNGKKGVSMLVNLQEKNQIATLIRACGQRGKMKDQENVYQTIKGTVKL